MSKRAAYVFIMKCQTQQVSHAYRWVTVRVAGLKCVFYPRRCYNFIKVSSSVWSRVTETHPRDPKQLKRFIPKYDEYSWHPLMSGVIIEVQRAYKTRAYKWDETATNFKWPKVEGNDHKETQNRQETPLKSQKRHTMIKNDQTWCSVTTINTKILQMSTERQKCHKSCKMHAEKH